jgi:hypothetical protein
MSVENTDLSSLSLSRQGQNMISLHIPSLTGRATVKMNPVFYQHAVPNGTDGFQELRVKSENRERKAEGFQYE